MDCYLGEIKLFAGTFAPVGFNFCDGTLLQISQNQTLYAILGITWGGDGVSTFALPDLRGRVLMGQGQGAGLHNRLVGQMGGAEAVTLVEANMPAHTHTFNVSTQPGAQSSANSTTMLSRVTSSQPTPVGYLPAGVGVNMNSLHSSSLAQAGNTNAHNNMMSFMVLNYIIATGGQFPTQN